MAGGIGSQEIEGDDGIFVTRITEGGVVDRDGRLSVGDRLLAVSCYTQFFFSDQHLPVPYTLFIHTLQLLHYTPVVQATTLILTSVRQGQLVALHKYSVINIIIIIILVVVIVVVEIVAVVIVAVINIVLVLIIITVITAITLIVIIIN